MYVLYTYKTQTDIYYIYMHTHIQFANLSNCLFCLIYITVSKSKTAASKPDGRLVDWV